MSPVSPEASSSTPVDTIAPPSYTADANAAVRSDEKIAIEQRHINDDSLPEVVTESMHQPTHTSPPPVSEYNPTSSVSPAPTSIANWDGTQSPPILQHPALAHQQYSGHESMSIPMQQTQRPTGPTVTPLHLLADQADSVDCPFCQRQTETKVKKSASSMTHIYATVLFFTTFFGVIFPYACHCAPNISHFCNHCGRKVAFKERGGQMEALGTPDHLREVSKYPAAQPQ